jgi:FkbM family methyltransferase
MTDGLAVTISMTTVRDWLKDLIVKSFGPELQHKIRRFHTIFQIMHNRHFHEPEMALLRSLISSGDFVADIGANVGVYTIELSRIVGPKGRVYAFEPVGENYDILGALLRKARLGNVSPFRLALGSKVSEGEIIVPEMDGFTGYYWAHVAQPGDRGRKQPVNILTLDELHRRRAIERLDFIKCDIEGGELEVIHGALDLIRTQLPGWLLEVSRETSGELFRILKDLGYRAYVYNNRLIETNGYRDKEYSNYFFLHPKTGRI